MTATSTDATGTQHPPTPIDVAEDRTYPRGLRTARVVLEISTRDTVELIDLTDHITAVVREHGLTTGWVDLACRHTSCGLVVNESETGLRKDVATLCAELVQAHPDRLWEHDNLDVRTENLVEGERPNAHSHMLTMMLASPTTRVWVEDGRLDLGRWQRVMLIEFDGPRPDPDLPPGQPPVHPVRQVVLHLYDPDRTTAPGSDRRNGATP